MSDRIDFGVLVLAHGTAITPYNIAQAGKCLVKSIRTYTKNNVPIAFVTHEAKWLEELSGDVDYIVEFPFGDAGFDDKNTQKNLYQLWYATPFERNLVVSLDSVCLQDLETIGDALNGHDIVFPRTSKTYNNNPLNNTGLVDLYNKMNLPRVLTDFWYFEKSKTQDFFDLLDVYSKNYSQIRTELGDFCPHEYNIDIVISLALDILNLAESSDDIGILEYTDMKHLGKDWQKRVNNWVKPKQIKVENFVLNGLVHLGRETNFRVIADEF